MGEYTDARDKAWQEWLSLPGEEKLSSVNSENEQCVFRAFSRGFSAGFSHGAGVEMDRARVAAEEHAARERAEREAAKYKCFQCGSHYAVRDMCLTGQAGTLLFMCEDCIKTIPG